jgi:branched-subunit amino acid aminotransferase/4-amino-4-deoxychorismate lyase
MNFKYFSKNGEVLPIVEAAIPLDNIAYAYGYGVYETIRVYKGVPYFLEHHIDRLLHSAQIIDLAHQFIKSGMVNAVNSLLAFTDAETYNLKLLLIGGDKITDSTLYIIPLSPFFPDRGAYKDGVSLITVMHERLFPAAKTLNMLGSYLAYKKAKAAGCYDALLLNNRKEITEGTKTSFMCVKDMTLYSPQQNEILEGITKKAVSRVAAKNGFKLDERKITLADLRKYDGCFLTSTSSHIIPITKINDLKCAIPENLFKLMKLFKKFYANCNGILTKK